ncbi:MarR family winged helix-turn-helix transcriptional regulator [Actinoplanes subglobosus]|uniref:MarR family winged helix-turn-helix transcriptional regulator n=1 Tax=Actinoplanes subglobosus TaxID=1547892 RepID=A0ABV8IZS4_9ACTN
MPGRSPADDLGGTPGEQRFGQEEGETSPSGPPYRQLDGYGLDVVAATTSSPAGSSRSTCGIRAESAQAVASVYQAANAVRAHVTNEVPRPVDLSWTGFVVLWVVWIWDGLETRHAAEAAAISKGTLTGVVKTLETRGLLTKQQRQDDRRLVDLRVTPAGTARMKEIFPRFNAIETRVVSGLSERRKKDLTASLRTIVTDIEDLKDKKN